MEIFSDYLVINSTKRILWGDIESFYAGDDETQPNFSLELLGNNVRLTFSEENRMDIFRVDKISKDNGENYLNVLVEESVSDMGYSIDNLGLFEIISMQEYNFYSPVQKEGKITSVKINGNTVTSYLKDIPGFSEKCYSLTLDDIIQPVNIKQYLVKN